MNTNTKTQKLVLAGLFAALTCIATMIIRVPTFKGYVHIGDCMVIASGILLGPWGGAFAAGIGSMLADLLGGYYVFSFATFIIKALAAMTTGLLYKTMKKLSKAHNIIAIILSGIASEVIVVLGYFVFEIFYEGFAIAVVEIIPNCVQGITGLIIATILIPLLLKIPTIRDKTYSA